MTLKSDATFEEKPICCLKNDKNLVNFNLIPQKSQKFALWLINLCSKHVITFDLKKYRGVITHNTEE